MSGDEGVSAVYYVRLGLCENLAKVVEDYPNQKYYAPSAGVRCTTSMCVLYVWLLDWVVGTPLDQRNLQ